MSEIDVFKVSILADGQVDIQKDTQTINDGEITGHTYWNCALEPGNFVDARAILPDYEYSLVESAWTVEVISAFQAAKEIKNSRFNE